MAVESGLALVYESASCPGVKQGGGFLTPAACMGTVLINRLHKAGIKFQVLGDKSNRSAGPDAHAAVAQFAGKAAKL